jgi:hypothetical protein
MRLRTDEGSPVDQSVGSIGLRLKCDAALDATKVEAEIGQALIVPIYDVDGAKVSGKVKTGCE